jgi:cyclopropane fatty-acyl-phospholipid synthase-like methyltransferase
MADYKARFYAAYYSTHIVPRKGEVTLDGFRAYARVFDRVWLHVLPENKSARILDAGCGSGSLVWWMQQRGYTRAGGIDVSHEQIQTAHALGVRQVETADLYPYLAERPESFDCLILRDVLEHFSRETIVELLELARNALRPEGALVLQVPNAGTPLWGRIRHGDFTHEMAFTEGSLRQLLGVAGYRQIRFHPSGPVLQGMRDLPRHLLWKAVETLYKVLVYAETGRRRAIVTEDLIAIASPAPSRASQE